MSAPPQQQQPAQAAAQGQGPPQAKTISTLMVVPPGPINKNKRHLLAKFMQAQPGFTPGTSHVWKMVAEKQDKERSRRGPPPKQNAPPALLLEKSAHPGEVTQRGIPEGGAAMAPTPGSNATPSSGSSYWLFVKAGRDITAYPIDLIYSFKPPPKRGGISLEDAEARMKADRESATGMGGLRLAPKSMREAAERMAQEAKQAKMTDGKFIPDDKPLTEDEKKRALAKLFGEDEDVDLEKGKGGRRGAAGGRKKKVVKGADGAVLDAEEIPEDIFEGLEGEAGMAPAKPEPAEDWEHQEEAADDDLSQGEGASEELQDDPGERIKLGLEGGTDEEEEEEEDEAAKKLKQKLAEEEGAEEEVAEGEGAAVDTTQADASVGGDEDEDLDLDELASSQLGATSGAAAGKRKPEGAAAADNGAANKRARTAQAGGAAIKAEPTAAVKTSPAIKQEPGVAAAAVKRERTPSPAPPSVTAAAARPAAAQGPASGASAGVATTEDIKQAVQAAGGRIHLNALRSMFAARLRAPGSVEVFKKNMMAVVKLVKGPDGSQLLELK